VNWIPLRSTLLIRLDDQTPEARQKLTVDADDYKVTGIIAAVGDEVRGNLLVPGRRVLLDKYAGTSVLEETVRYRLVDEKDVVAVERA